MIVPILKKCSCCKLDKENYIIFENVNSKLTYHVLKFYDIDDKDDEKDDEKRKNIMMIIMQ